MEPNYDDLLAEDSLFLLDLCPKQAFPRCSPEDNLAQKWLEHLCTYEVEDLNDRRIRNIYISHLCTALVKGQLYGPFLKEPPCGKLEKVDFTTQAASCSSVNPMLPQQRMQYRPPRAPCPGAAPCQGPCDPSCQAPCAAAGSSQSASCPAPSSPRPTPPAPFMATSTSAGSCPLPSASYATQPGQCPLSSTQYSTPPGPCPTTSPCPGSCQRPSTPPGSCQRPSTPPGSCPAPSATYASPPGTCPAPSAQYASQPGTCPAPSAQYASTPGSCPAPSATYASPPGSCPAPSAQYASQPGTTSPAQCSMQNTAPCSCPRPRTPSPSPCPSQFQSCPPAAQASSMTMGATCSQPSMSQPSVATLGATRSGVPSQGQISACSVGGAQPLCTCPPTPCQCTARGQPCTCSRSRAGAEKKTVDDEEIICNYLMQQLNFTPDFLTSFDATLSSFMDLCKGASLDSKTKPKPKSPSEFSSESGKQHFLPNCESSTIETNASSTTQDTQDTQETTRSSSPTNDIDDMRDDINKLLAAIMAELSGDVEPGSNDYLDRELARYKGFLMANSRLKTNLKTLKCDMKLRNCLLLSLQNDLVKLLNEHHNNNK